MPCKSRGSAASAPDDPHRRLDKGPHQRLKTAKATDDFHAEDRGRLGSLSAQIAELQQNIEVKRLVAVSQPG